MTVEVRDVYQSFQDVIDVIKAGNDVIDRGEYFHRVTLKDSTRLEVCHVHNVLEICEHVSNARTWLKQSVTKKIKRIKIYKFT